MAKLPYLPEPSYINTVKKRTKSKYVKRAIEMANDRLANLREFLDINPNYTSAALDNLEAKTKKGFTFQMPRKGKILRQIGAAYDRIYNMAYSFLQLKSSTPEGVEDIESGRQAHLDSIREEAKAKSEAEMDEMSYRQRELNDIEQKEIDEMEEALGDMSAEYENWTKEEKNNFWKLYRDFKDDKGIPYQKQDAEEYQSTLMAAILSGADDPVKRATAYLQGRISYRELLGLRKLMNDGGESNDSGEE